MKDIICFCKIFVILLFLINIFSCNEEKFLNEIPKDFFSPENAYVSFDDFNASVLKLYDRYRGFVFEPVGENDFNNLAWSLTELAYPNQGRWDNVQSILLPTNSGVIYDGLWKPMYEIIYHANVIIGRIDSNQNELDEKQKNRIKAEAFYFRAYAHKLLANMFGGVPIVLEETKEPKRDYLRDEREKVYDQCIADLEFAVKHLPNIDDVDCSRLNNLAASHLLSELYITVGRWDDAIDAASLVINHPNTDLMTERFGNKVEKPEYLGFNDDPNWAGDVYWDLFYTGNHDRSKGNKEAIWVLPTSYNIPGGGTGGFGVRCLMPRTWQLKVKNRNGTEVQIIPDPNENYGGRGGGFIKPSPYFSKTLWDKSGEEDIRNAPHNIIRDWVVRNPASEYVGKYMVKDNLPFPMGSYNDTMRNFFPAVAKGSTFQSFPEELKIPDQTIPGAIGHTDPCKKDWKDFYAIRLAETYLLRAEAYLGKNDLINAAKDVNAIRKRANANEVVSSEIDIDFILDERMRELCFEELYLATLQRLNKTIERSRKYDLQLGPTYLDHNNLWPIPFADIEKNVESTLEQNPGYN